MVSFLLTERISSYQFSVIWRHIQYMGWMFKLGTYYSPDSTHIGTSTDVAAYFDLPVTNPRCSQRNKTHRDLLLRKLFQHAPTPRQIEPLSPLVSPLPEEPASLEDVDEGARAYIKKKPPRKSTNRIDLPSPRACAVLREELPALEKLRKRHAASFRDWAFLLATGHSLLLYGFGSKRELLLDFSATLREEGECLVVDGYDHRFDAALLLDAIHPTPRSSLLEKAKSVAARYRSSPDPLFLLVHNIDRLKTPLVQETLADLHHHSKSPEGRTMIRIVASVDHVDASLSLWDAPTLHKFAWVSPPSAHHP